MPPTVEYVIVCTDIPELSMCKFLSVDFIGNKFGVKLFLFFINEETTAIAIAKIRTSNKLSY